MHNMPNSKRTYRNPGYGEVRQLCKNLGCGPDLDMKSYNEFRRRIAQHRHDFIKNSCGMTHFPLDCNDSQVKLCVSTFLEKSPTEFSGSQTWIADQLAKLLCMQEYYSRNTQESKRTKGRKKSKRQSDESDTEMSSAESDARYEEFNDPSLWDGPKSPSTAPSSAAWSAYPSQYRESSTTSEDSEDTQIKIMEHLALTYPLDGMEEGKNGDWMFEKSLFPIECQPYIFRYLHEHNLYKYNQQPSTINAIEKFRNELVKHLNIKRDGMPVYKKCESIVSYYPKTWLKWGLLKKSGEGIERTPTFDKAFRSQQARWIALVRDLAPETFASECCTAKTNTGTAGGKRPREQSVPLHGENNSDQEIHPAASTSSFGIREEFKPSSRPRFRIFKRSRTVACQNPAYGLGTGHPDASASIDLTVDDSPNIKMEAEEDVHYNDKISSASNLQRRAPVADMGLGSDTPFKPTFAASEASLGRRTIPAVDMENFNIPSSRTLVPTFTASTSMSNKFASEFALPNGQSIANQDSVPKEAASITRRASTQLPSPPLQSPMTTAIPAAQFGSANFAQRLPSIPAAARPNTTARLDFRFEESRGAPDFDDDNLVSRQTLWNLNLAGVFDLVCDRTSQTPDMVSFLTFRYQWGGFGSLIVHRHSTEQDWESTKKKMKSLFINATRKRPEENSFEFWVEGDGHSSIETCGEGLSKKEDDGWGGGILR